jgi:hypothetical protein
MLELVSNVPPHVSRPSTDLNSPNKPWHNRYLIPLPTTRNLGLENFTTHPTTPPLYIEPIALPNDVYALRVTDAGDDLSKTPYIAALEDHRYSYTPDVIGLKTVYASSPVSEVEGCPEQLACITTGFSVYEDVGRKLAYGGFEGGWKAERDAGTEGWHVYWVKESERGSGAIELGIVAKVAAY